MTIRRFVVPVVTDGSGDAEEYTPVFSGTLISIRYVKTDYASGVDFELTSEASGEGLWSEEDVNSSATRYPRTVSQDTSGADALYADMGVEVLTKIALAHDRVKIVVASGGDTKTGAFHVTIDG